MNENNSEQNRFELSKKQHENEFKRYSINEDLASKLDLLHEQLQQVQIKHTVTQNTYKPYIKGL